MGLLKEPILAGKSVIIASCVCYNTNYSRELPNRIPIGDRLNVRLCHPPKKDILRLSPHQLTGRVCLGSDISDKETAQRSIGAGHNLWKKNKINETEGRFCASYKYGAKPGKQAPDRDIRGSRRDSLAARLKAGDREAAVELVDLYYQQIYLFMRRLGHSRQVSEDLTQESFLSAWGHIWQLRDGKALNNWLYRIALNASRLYWRRHGGSEPASLDEIDVADSSEPEADKVGRYEQLDQLKDAVARLPMKLRQAVVLHYMQYLTIAEAAEAAGLRESTFKSRLNRALKVLRKQFV